MNNIIPMFIDVFFIFTITFLIIILPYVLNNINIQNIVKSIWYFINVHIRIIFGLQYYQKYKYLNYLRIFKKKVMNDGFSYFNKSQALNTYRLNENIVTTYKYIRNTFLTINLDALDYIDLENIYLIYIIRYPMVIKYYSNLNEQSKKEYANLLLLFNTNITKIVKNKKWRKKHDL